MPGRPSVITRRTSVDALDGADTPAGLSSVVVKVAAGAGDKCVAPARSRPKRRQTIRHDSDDDTLDVRSVQWTSAPGMRVSELADQHYTECPLLAKVTEDYADFMRGQVIITDLNTRTSCLFISRCITATFYQHISYDEHCTCRF